MNDTSSTFLSQLNALTEFHLSTNKIYADYVNSLFPDYLANQIEEVPYLPVRAFKEADLSSLPKNQIIKYMQSSGTTSSVRSMIPIDNETAKLQVRELTKNFTEMFGQKRKPMIFVGEKSANSIFTAQDAALNGFSTFSTEKFNLIDHDGNVNRIGLRGFLEKYLGQEFYVVGFTFKIWSFLETISIQDEFDFSRATIIHGGGWKKLKELNISDDDFKSSIEFKLSCTNVRNYYGMIEQTGSIYFECEKGKLHAPFSGGTLIRNPISLEVMNFESEGLIQVLSTIQKSYPGHSLLSEDLGSLSPVRSCECGRQSQTLKINGRLSNAEVRGCSDATH